MQPLLQPLANSVRAQPHQGWLWCVWVARLGDKFGSPVTFCSWLTTPQTLIFVEFTWPQNEAPFHPPANSTQAQPYDSWLWYVWIFRLSGSTKFGPPVGFGYALQLPPPPQLAKICPKMHSTKQSCRSIAWLNLAKPSHLGINCGVAVEQPWGYSLILPSDFVRGHRGGWWGAPWFLCSRCSFTWQWLCDVMCRSNTRFLESFSNTKPYICRQHSNPTQTNSIL